jgi:pimeloyl-ACP methyl ester carboxylesterase
MQDNRGISETIDAGGVKTYYQSIGEGEPVVLLHGGLCTVETWGGQVPALSEKYRLFMPERRAHGRSPDVEGPVTFEMMADDTIAFMDKLRIASAHLIGWSDGAYTALLVALRRPDLVKKLVYISEPISGSGITPKFQEMTKHMTPAHLPPHLQQAYAAVSPDGPEHFPVVAEKFMQLWRQEKATTVQHLRSLTVPTLVMIGDDDLCSVAHAGELLDAIPSAQLAVVPGTSHALIMEKPALVNRLILDFLTTEQAEKQFK